MLFALILAAGMPWVEMSGGPVFLRESGRPGLGSGPLLRVDLGVPLAERAATEVWLSGAMETAPMGSPGDRALLGGGLGGRLRVAQFGEDGKIGIWAHAGAGWGVPAAGAGSAGPTGFAGALFSYRPFVQRFSVGIEADALAYKNAIGLALMPSLRCTF